MLSFISVKESLIFCFIISFPVDEAVTRLIFAKAAAVSCLVWLAGRNTKKSVYVRTGTGS